MIKRRRLLGGLMASGGLVLSRPSLLRANLALSSGSSVAPRRDGRWSPWSRPKMDAPRGHSSISTRHDISLLSIGGLARGMDFRQRLHPPDGRPRGSPARSLACRRSMIAAAMLIYRDTALQEAETNGTRWTTRAAFRGRLYCLGGAKRAKTAPQPQVSGECRFKRVPRF